MRKLLDWIADKLGYQRKFTFVPIQFPPLAQELIDDGIAMGCPFPEIISETMSSEDFPLEIIAPMNHELSPGYKLQIYDDDHGSPGKITDRFDFETESTKGTDAPNDLFIVKD